MVDLETIERTLLSHRVQLLGYLRSIVRDRTLAEDILQDVAVLAIRKAAEIDDVEHLDRWLRQTARYRASYELRKRDHRPRLLGEEVLDLLDRSWEQFDRSASSDMLAAVPGCLEKLSPYARQLVRHRFEDNLTGRQIADRIGRNLNAVYVAMARIYRRLDECIRRAMLRTRGKQSEQG
jgi:RNA polymerase sigma-70 factor, ECF subfamily